MSINRFKWETRGIACNENIVKGDKYRFSILTPSLIRMEYDDSGLFEDRASQHFLHRDFMPVLYSIKRDNGLLTVETEHLILTYKENTAFSSNSLGIRLKCEPFGVWNFGDKTNNLKGTVSTLDNVDGRCDLEDGIISKNGFVVVDDSNTCLFSDDGWFEVRRKCTKDYYFFGYGYKYIECIKDFYRLSGVPPLLPDYALGNWWSRFYSYTQDEYCTLIERFEKENIPFSVAVIDMGWHKSGWTGYSWNTKLFPDYKQFLRFLKNHNLKIALNLHPADGVKCHEDMYDKMALSCGIDPKSQKTVKFDCLNPKFMESYFDILHHPYESDGVDFWWMDWQQGTDYSWIHDDDNKKNDLECINPLWLLNHLHIVDISRNGKRPMFFSRYCGLGSHRYPVGFSGDTIITWESLDFQPYFTATASNVGYSWWSHDIGGHMNGYRDDELTVRWMQYGVLSPINRLHSSNGAFMGKEPWNLHSYLDNIARDWLRLRHRLFPYIYTMNYRNHTELIPMIIPMYYTYPQNYNAYNCPNQYWFGSEIFVAPITDKTNKVTGLAKTKVWFPKGDWIDVFNGYVYSGEKQSNIYRNIEQQPIFAQKGAIIPLQKFNNDNKLGRSVDMELLVFAGADNSFVLYEDEGDGNSYKSGCYATTKIEQKWNEKVQVIIHSAKGETDLLPKQRNWKITLRGFNKPSCVLINNNSIDFIYKEENASIIFDLKNILTMSDITVTVIANGETLLYDNKYYKNRIFDIILHSQIDNKLKEKIWSFAQTGSVEKLFDECDKLDEIELLNSISEMLDII